MLEAGGFHLLDTLRHNFQVSNKDDTEDFQTLIRTLDALS